jgi:hypothetical protein
LRGFRGATVLDRGRGLSSSAYGRVLLLESWNGCSRLGVTREFDVMSATRRGDTWNEDSNEFVQKRLLGRGFLRFLVLDRRGGSGV